MGIQFQEVETEATPGLSVRLVKHFVFVYMVRKKNYSNGLRANSWHAKTKPYARFAPNRKS